MAKRGGLLKMYYNSGTYASPTWVVIDLARDVTLTLGKGEGDGSVRAVDWELVVAGLKTLELSFDIRYEPGETQYDDLRDAFHGDTVQDFAVMGGDIGTIGSEGVRFPGLVTNFARNEPLNDTSTSSVTVKPSIDPTDLTNVPEKYEISS